MKVRTEYLEATLGLVKRLEISKELICEYVTVAGCCCCMPLLYNHLMDSCSYTLLAAKGGCVCNRTVTKVWVPSIVEIMSHIFSQLCAVLSAKNASYSYIVQACNCSPVQNQWLALCPLTAILKAPCSSPLSSARLSTIPWGRGRQYKWRPLLVSLVTFLLMVTHQYERTFMTLP